MSWFLYDPDATVPVIDHTPCPFHRDNPGKHTPFCVCSTGIGSRPATPEEYRARRRWRITERAVELHAELASIEAELTAFDALDDEQAKVPA